MTRTIVRSLLLGIWAAAATAALAQNSPEITADSVIAGTMEINFNTRTQLDNSGNYKEGSPRPGAKDEYRFTLSVAQTVEFSGTISRQPNIYTKTFSRTAQNAALGFDISIAVLNPKDMKQKKVVGKWVGTVPIDTASGAFQLAAGVEKESPLRIAIDTVGSAQGFADNFGGRLVGKAEKKESLAAYTFKRIVGNKTVAVTVKKSDPMRFDNIILAKGPAESYPRTTVSGRLDYDYETGNWYTDGIRFRYSLDGKEFEDVVTGSIKWIEDPNRESNGKGFYDFNLRFNEEKNKTAATETAAFEGLSEEDAFFVVDNTIPCLTGTVEYVDTFVSGSDLPATSQVTYKLNANKLNKQQIVNFFKLWMLAVGPTNDE